MTGLIFGSFDPPHLGHFLLAKAALAVCDKIIFVPAYQNPFKDKSTDFSLRVEMLEAMIEDYEAWDKMTVSPIEGTFHTRFGHSYTYEIVKYFNELETKEKFCMVTTPETLKEIPEWKNGNWILNNIQIVLMSNSHRYVRHGIIRVGIFDNINVHSSDIRKSICFDENPFPYVTSGVYEIIKRENLYKV